MDTVGVGVWSPRGIAQNEITNPNLPGSPKKGDIIKHSAFIANIGIDGYADILQNHGSKFNRIKEVQFSVPSSGAKADQENALIAKYDSKIPNGIQISGISKDFPQIAKERKGENIILGTNSPDDPRSNKSNEQSAGRGDGREARVALLLAILIVLWSSLNPNMSKSKVNVIGHPGERVTQISGALGVGK